MEEYPVPVFHFSVDWAGKKAAFSEVTGLNTEAQVIEYRDGNDPLYTSLKMPGLKKFGNVTLKRGVFSKDNEYFDWLNATKLNKPDRRDVIINLLDEDGNPVMKWTLRKAWPTKITAPDLKGSGNEAAIESIEIAHEGLTIENS